MSNTNHTFHATALPTVNEALVVLGQDVLLTELSTASTDVNSRKAAYLYEAARAKVLREYPWNFARDESPTTSTLVKTHEGDEMPWRTMRPARMSRLLACYNGGKVVSHRLTATDIWSDKPIDRVVYMRDVEDLNKWSTDAYRALVLRLAADLAKPITGRINERQLQEAAYADQLAEAKLADARENNIPYDAWGKNYYVDCMRGNDKEDRDADLRRR